MNVAMWSVSIGGRRETLILQF